MYGSFGIGSCFDSTACLGKAPFVIGCVVCAESAEKGTFPHPDVAGIGIGQPYELRRILSH